MKKKANLVPTDEVTIFYDVKPGYLGSVVAAHLTNITSSVRATVIQGKCPEFDEPIAASTEDMKGEFMKGEKLSLQVARGTIDPNAKQLPAVKFNTISTPTGDAFVLLENPRGCPVPSAAGDIFTGSSKTDGSPNFVNLKFIGTDRYGLNQGALATVILNNPGFEIKDIEGLKAAGAKIFGWEAYPDENCCRRKSLIRERLKRSFCPVLSQNM